MKKIFTLSLLVVLACVFPGGLFAQQSQSSTPPAVSTPHQTDAPTAQVAPNFNMSADKLTQAIQITRIRHTLAIAGTIWGILSLWLFVSLGFAAKLDRYTQRLSPRRFVQGILYFVFFVLITTALDLPLSIIGQIVSRHYKISVQSWLSTLSEFSISLVGSLTIGVLLFLLFNWIVRKSPRRFWLWSWLLVAPLLVTTILVEPYFERLYDKIEPLEKSHPALTAKLEQLVARTDTSIPKDKIFITFKKEKSNGVNAYVTGIGATKRMVIWDTTADRLPEDEVVLIMAHESGHYVLNHIPKQLAIDSAITLVLFFLSAQLGLWLFARYGEKWQLSSLDSRAGFTTLLLALSIVGTFIEPAINAVSRHYEHQADVYGQEAVHTLVPDPQKTAVNAFNHLGELWLVDPTPSPFFEFWYGNHPSTTDRVNFAAHYNPWANNGHGEFFEK